MTGNSLFSCVRILKENNRIKRKKKKGFFGLSGVTFSKTLTFKHVDNLHRIDRHLHRIDPCLHRIEGVLHRIEPHLHRIEKRKKPINYSFIGFYKIYTG